MTERGVWKWGALLLAMVTVFAVGCAKKQTVQSTETAPPTAAAPAPAPAPEAAPGGIVTEPVAPEPAKPAETQIAAAEAGAAVTAEAASRFADIHFDFDKSNILDKDKATLAAIAEHMKKNAGAKLLIEGHCDERGTAEYNMALGDRRAESARKYLVSLGVSPPALSTVSFGEEKPLDPGHTEDAWAKNRRAHFVLK